MIVNILAALFPYRKEITHIDLTKVRFNMLETTTIIKAISPLTQLQSIIISQTKFNADSLYALLSLVSQMACQAFVLTLSECFLNDEVLKKNKKTFLQCTNIEKLDLSFNDITMQSFDILIDLSIEENCKIKELNISKNKINNLLTLGQFIRYAKQIEAVYADDCGFTFDDTEELTSFFKCCKSSKLKKLSLLRNDLLNNLHTFEELWAGNPPEEINIDVGTFAEKTSRNLQGKLLI
jgi:Leucine-rich repeat (LRR) protein